MGLFKNIKQGLAAVTAPPTPEQMEAALAAMTPEQRAAYDANMARVAEGQAESQASYEEARALSEQARILEGPAGDYLYGPGLTDENSPEAVMARMQDEGVGSMLKGMMKESMSGFGAALKDTVDGGKRPQIEDPEERARVATDERAARDAARAPYLAPSVPAITISRLTTRGATQIDEVMAYLRQSGLADRPDRVYGVYRVPDRISPTLTLHSEAGRVVEWDVVHEPGADTGPTATEVDDAWFPSRQQWVARRRGEPSILDEDLALAYCVRAGLPPERCFGIARHSEFVRSNWGDEDGGEVYTRVTGVHVLHPAGAGGDALARMADEAPLALGPDAIAGAHTEVLNALEIRRAVHPRIQDRVPVPLPFPYLPASPQELLRMYLEVVGVTAADCYGAQVTVHRHRALIGRMGAGTTNVSPKQPCADGKDRGRAHGAEQVVVTYRDRPEYVEGRARWAAYQQAVLRAHLERGNEVRSAVWVDDDSDIDNGLLRAGATLLRGMDRIAMLGEGKPPPPFRYCWPPVP